MKPTQSTQILMKKPGLAKRNIPSPTLTSVEKENDALGTSSRLNIPCLIRVKRRLCCLLLCVLLTRSTPLAHHRVTDIYPKGEDFVMVRPNFFKYSVNRRMI